MTGRMKRDVDTVNGGHLSIGHTLYIDLAEPMLEYADAILMCQVGFAPASGVIRVSVCYECFVDGSPGVDIYFGLCTIEAFGGKGDELR